MTIASVCLLDVHVALVPDFPLILKTVYNGVPLPHNEISVFGIFFVTSVCCRNFSAYVKCTHSYMLFGLHTRRLGIRFHCSKKSRKVWLHKDNHRLIKNAHFDQDSQVPSVQ